MKNIIQKITSWIWAHKIWSILIIVVVIGTTFGVIKSFAGDDEEVRYVFASVEKGTIVSSVTGTGQVSASDQVDITAKASGDLIYLNAKAGQAVSNGALIGQIDSGDASYELESAQLSYENLITIDQDDIQDAEDHLKNAYTDARSSLTTASTDMADVVTGVDNLFSGYLNTTNNYSIGKSTREYVDRAEDAYWDADKSLGELVKKYRTLSAATSREDIESMIDESYEVAVSAAQAAKYAQDAVMHMRDREDEESAEADDAYTTVTGLVSKANSVVSSLSSVKSSLKTSKRALADLQSGPDALDIRSSQLSVRQKQEALANYYIRAPFAGILASVDAKKGERVSSGSTIATLITKQKIAEISLNEIDAAKVQIGQKATLTFDAFEDLTISGEVVEVDLIGTVSQGVVNYTVKIAFDTDDDLIKPGMTVSASVITEMKQDVLMVPASAIKSQGDMSYVEVVDGTIPEGNSTTGVALTTIPSRVEVVTGISNDESVEIVSGLEEGQQYVARTITATTQSSAQSSSAPSLFGGSTGGSRPTGGGGMMFR